MILKRIFHQFNGDIDIRHFLMIFGVRMAAMMASNLTHKKMTVKNVEVLKRLKRLQKNLLPLTFVLRFFHNGRKVFCLDQRLLGLEKLFSQFLEIEPVKPLPVFRT